ncbi:MAG: hypothetical protein HKN52_09305 [Eudoraea sp.]|nr:hypothetical protein [Eudoraea sp.]
MKKVILFLGLMVSMSSMAQVAYLQYRVVPNDRENEFVQKETMYWAKVAAAAIDKGQMTGWSLWRKIGITEVGAPNYVFVNNFESFDKVDQGAIWSAENIKAMGVSPDMVQTSSFAPTAFDYWMQLEDTAGGDYKYAVVNYAKPVSLGGFIEENKTLWKPLHEKSIANGSMGMTSWGLMSVVHPKGKQARFDAMTWDGFNTMADAMNYMSYQSTADTSADWTAVMDKTKMGDIMPDGFEYTILYELVMRIAPD